MKLTDQQINEIVDNFNSGMRCFYNFKPLEIRTDLIFDNWIGADEEPLEEDLKGIEENWEDYYEFDSCHRETHLI